MENVYKLFDIWKQILKVQKLYENENKECYKLVLEDFVQKKEDILSYFEKNYAVLQSVAEKIEKNAGFDYDDNEKFVKKKFRRTWKDCSYGVLKILDERGYIFNNYKSKSIVITDAGIQKALEIYQDLYHEPYEMVQ